MLIYKDRNKLFFWFFLGSAAGPYPRPSLLPTREASMGLHHPSDLLARPYADQLVHQVSASRFINVMHTVYIE